MGCSSRAATATPGCGVRRPCRREAGLRQTSRAHRRTTASPAVPNRPGSHRSVASGAASTGAGSAARCPVPLVSCPSLVLIHGPGSRCRVQAMTCCPAMTSSAPTRCGSDPAPHREIHVRRRYAVGSRSTLAISIDLVPIGLSPHHAADSRVRAPSGVPRALGKRPPLPSRTHQLPAAETPPTSRHPRSPPQGAETRRPAVRPVRRWTARPSGFCRSC